jgi:hypothetical protein
MSKGKFLIIEDEFVVVEKADSSAARGLNALTIQYNFGNLDRFLE